MALVANKSVVTQGKMPLPKTKEQCFSDDIEVADISGKTIPGIYYGFLKKTLPSRRKGLVSAAREHFFKGNAPLYSSFGVIKWNINKHELSENARRVFPQSFGSLSTSAFPTCCGTELLYSFPYQLGGNLFVGRNRPTTFLNALPSADSAYVNQTREESLSMLLVHVDQCIRYTIATGKRKSYVIVTLNHTQQRLLAKALVGYLNFKRLDDDWRNRTGSANVGVYGLCLNSYNERNIT